jgi:hypothetical protein
LATPDTAQVEAAVERVNCSLPSPQQYDGPVHAAEVDLEAGLKTKMVILDRRKSFLRNYQFFPLNKNGDDNRKNGNENGKNIR